MNTLIETTTIEEINAVKKNLSKVKLKIALCYPNIYRVGMASLGLQLIYRLWNSFDDIACERTFLPMNELVEPYTLESDRPLREMDVIAFTMQYEDDYINILRILERAHIPVEAAERDGRYPLILAGGPCAQSNPVPMAPFIDAFMIGDLEPINDELIYEGLLKEKIKDTRLEILDSYKWMWVPRKTIDKKVTLSPKGDINNYFYPTKQIISQLEEEDPWLGAFGKTFMLEVVRGCNRGCTFCLIGKITRPRRNRSIEKLQELYREGVKECKVKKITTIGAGISDYPDLEKLCQSVYDDNLTFSLPAIRADKITENLVQLLVKTGQKTITTAPEAGSKELRTQICKEISNDEIINAIKTASEGGLSKVKAYFILGLPEETEEDVIAIANLAKQMSDAGRNIRKIRISASFFVPKPRTAFQNQPLFSLERLFAKEKILTKHISKIPRVDCEISNPKWSRIQSILSISGQEISKPLKLVAKLGGGLGDWRRVLNEHNMKIEDIVEKREAQNEYPWDFIVLE